MKVIGILVACLMLACSVAVADSTGNANYDNPVVQTVVDNLGLQHHHEYDNDMRAKLGLGLDLVVYENGGRYSNNFYINQVSLQNKWDLNNSNYSLFAVVEVDVYGAVMDYIR